MVSLGGYFCLVVDEDLPDPHLWESTWKGRWGLVVYWAALFMQLLCVLRGTELEWHFDLIVRGIFPQKVNSDCGLSIVD